MLLDSDSSSPSNTHPSVHGPNSLEVTIEDKLYLALRVKKLAAYIGFSMGRLRAYHLVYPDLTERMMHNISSLEAQRSH